MPEEEKKKEVTGKAKEDTHELHEARDKAYEKMIVWANPAGLEPPTPQPEKKKSDQESKGQ